MREVAVEVDPASVLAGAARHPVGGDRPDHPEVDTCHGATVAQAVDDAEPGLLVAVHRPDDDSRGPPRLAQVVRADRPVPDAVPDAPGADDGRSRPGGGPRAGRRPAL